MNHNYRNTLGQYMQVLWDEAYAHYRPQVASDLVGCQVSDVYCQGFQACLDSQDRSKVMEDKEVDKPVLH